MSEAEKFYQQVRNTYYYTLESSEGLSLGTPDNPLGHTTFQLPPFRYPEHQQSNRCIFKLTDFYVISQTADDRLTQIGSVVAGGDGAFDISGFVIEIGGIGLSGQDINTAWLVSPISGQPLPQGNAICVFNKFAQFNTLNGGSSAITNDGALTLAGSSDIDAYRICSNPAGTDVSIKVLSLDSGVELVNNGNIQWVIKFEIQVVPDNSGDPRRQN